MIEATGAIDVYFEEEIEILMLDDTLEFPTGKAKEILKENEVEFSRIQFQTAG